MSTDDSLSNLTTKYNRLISDYKSLREKYNFLKTALITERDKSKELECLFAENGIKSRKVLQELESLKFRNDMLSKQVNTLRDELDHEKQSKSSKKGPSKAKESGFPSLTKSDEIVVIKEELINKIDECSSLHSQLASLQLEYQTDTNNFRSAINDLENQLKLVKSQNSIADANIRKALAKEINERSALELKLENKDNLIHKLKNSEKNLLQEISDLQQKSLNQSTTDSGTPILSDNNIDNCSMKSKEMKKSESLNGSLSSIPINDNLNTNEIYMCSLIDKIGQLERNAIGFEMENQITEKRHQIEKKHRELYEEFILNTGHELPKLESNRTTQKIEKFLLTDNNQCIVEFYEAKLVECNKQLLQTVAKAALFYDEAKALNHRLDIEHEENVGLREKIESMKEKIISSQDDLDLTARQYENKMKEMSIHIAELNTQLETRKLMSYKTQQFGDYNPASANENVSSIKGFINSLKK